MYRKKLPLLVLAACASLTQVALAQEPDEPVGSMPDSDPPPATTPAAKTAPPKPPPGATVASGAACLATNNGLDQASAYTGWQLVCDEIRNQGVALAPPGADTATAYRVTFDRLGTRLVLRVSYETPVGHAARARKMVLEGPEELPVAAPRIAHAVVTDSPLEDSERVDNLVGDETRTYKKKHGEFLWGLGLFGVSSPAASVVATPGAEFMGYYETPDYGFGFTLRTSFGSTQDDSLYYGAIGVGGRYFFSDADIGPFAGAGMAASWLSVDHADTDFYGKGSGFGAYAEIGVEFLRLHSSRLVLALRADVPFYSVKPNDYGSYDYTTGATTQPKTGSEYHLPLSLSATYAW